jgi:hypothetical protein
MMKKNALRGMLLVGLLCVFLSHLFAATDTIDNLNAVRVEKGPVVDGKLDDECWGQAAPFTGFRQQEPVPSSTPSEPTELRVIYDRDNLYLGIICFDSEVSKVAAKCMAHDQFQIYRGVDDDVVRVLLDPFQDKRNAYIFITNACGAKSEGLARGERYSLNWDGIWDVRSHVFDEGWSVEMRIPFKTISFKKSLTAWGLNIERYIARKQETIRLSRPELDAHFAAPMNAALLHGIADVKQGKGITFRPYGTLSLNRIHEAETQTEWKIDGGFDIYKNFTPNFVGAFTFNTDFAETEVDERRINLTRFSLYFPEKRTFFLEGSEIFSFGVSGGGGGGGMRGPSFVPFFSRRIGLVEEQQVPILYGAKVFGKLGNTNMSLIDMRTQSFDPLDLPAENFVAGRIYQNILAESKVGLIFTHGDPSSEERNSLVGVDFTYWTSRFMGDKNFSLAGWYVYNWNELETGEHQGYGFKIDYPNDLWDVAMTYSYYGNALNPGLGYMRRNNVKVLSGGMNFRPRPKKGFLADWIRQFFFELRPSFYWDLAGKLESMRIFVAPLNFRTEKGEHIEFNVTFNRDVPPEDFEIAEGIIIPQATYDFTNYNIQYSSSSYRSLIFSGEYRFGPFYSGSYRDAELELTFRLNGHVNLGINANLVKGKLKEGEFTENVFQLKADFFLTPDLGLMNYIQYDDVSKTLGANIRFRWQLSPGNEVFLVYNSSWERRWDPTSRFVPLETRGIFKISLSVRP